MSAEPPLKVGYFAVCILDLLGQTAELAKWSKLPTDGQMTPEMLSCIQKTAGRVMHFKNAFIDLFERFATSALTPEQQKLLEVKKAGLYARFRTWPLKTQQFSDTFLFYCPLTNADGDTSVQPLYRMLAACGIAMLGSLADKMPLRGAICIGTGMELEDGNFYGHALAQAHSLESKVARYPRVVVSEEVVSFLGKNRGFSGDGDIDALLGIMAETCRMMLYADDDAKTIVDFLGPAMRHFAQPGVNTAIEAIREFVQSEVARFASMPGKECQDLAGRYRRLQRYVGLASLFGAGDRRRCR